MPRNRTIHPERLCDLSPLARWEIEQRKGWEWRITEDLERRLLLILGWGGQEQMYGITREWWPGIIVNNTQELRKGNNWACLLGICGAIGWIKEPWKEESWEAWPWSPQWWKPPPQQHSSHFLWIAKPSHTQREQFCAWAFRHIFFVFILGYFYIPLKYPCGHKVCRLVWGDQKGQSRVRADSHCSKSKRKERHVFLCSRYLLDKFT